MVVSTIIRLRRNRAGALTREVLCLPLLMGAPVPHPETRLLQPLLLPQRLQLWANNRHMAKT